MAPPDDIVRTATPPRHLWPDLIFTLPALQYPARLNATAELLDTWLPRGHGNAACLIGPTTSWTYAETAAQVNRIANVLANRCGVRPGQPVLLRAANCPMMAACILAVIKLGAIAVPTMPMLRARELAYPIAKARIEIALCDAALGAELTATDAPTLRRTLYFHSDAPDGLEALMAGEPATRVPADTDAEDVCLLAFTSGTTGEPKGTMHLHRDLLATCDTYGSHVLHSTATDRFIGSPPLAFTFGLGGLVLFPLRVGAATILLERVGPDDLLAAIPRFRPTICFTAPTAYRAILAKLPGADLSSLRACVSAGEHLPRATFDAWLAATGLRLMDGIGATEMLHIFIGSPSADARPGATGRVVPGYEARIIDAHGNEVPDNVVGRLAVRGPTGCRYMDDPRQAIYVQHGWNITGDSFLRDQDGYFWYQARNDDMIVSAGYNIAGPEVEGVLLLHPAVAECAVIATEDAARGAIVTAIVVLRPGHTPDAAMTETLQSHVKSTIDYSDSLPRTPTGKLQRFLLRQDLTHRT